MNPALAARCFLLISFAGKMTAFNNAGADGIATATPLAILKTTPDASMNLMDMFVGRIPGTIGEVSKICLLIGALYLIVRKVISPKMPLIYIGTVALFTLIFSGRGFREILKKAVAKEHGATVFGYYVDDPERFGIVEFDGAGKAISIEEKPEKPKSNYCVTGLYFYDNKVVDYAKSLKPSKRGELEITDLNRIYLEKGELDVALLGQGFTWLDTGTHESLVDATNFVCTIETHEHRKIACLEEIAYRNGWISKEKVLEAYELLKKNEYGKYLKDVLDGKYIEEQ